jgi:cytoskeletal protein CcmA (bactofilin family)
MANEFDCYIDQDSTLTGTLSTNGDILIDGSFQGNIASKTGIKIFTPGKVQGTIESKEIFIEGEVKGNIQSEGRLILSSSSKVECDVVATKFVVHEGAQLKGSFAITPDQQEQGTFRKKIQAEAAKPKRVNFSATFPNAKEVLLIGSFNEWDEDKAFPMKSSGKNTWATQIDLISGTYEYLFLVDGDPQPDPENPRKEKNSYGGENSILTVD